MTQRVAPAPAGFDGGPKVGLDVPSVTGPGASGLPPGSEFGAAHHRPGRYGHVPDDDLDLAGDVDCDPARPGGHGFADLWPTG